MLALVTAAAAQDEAEQVADTDERFADATRTPATPVEDEVEELAAGSGGDAAPAPAGDCTLPSDGSPLVAAACARLCDGGALCFRADSGAPLCGPLPRQVGVGTELVLKVVGPAGCADGIRLDTASQSSAAWAAPGEVANPEELVELRRTAIRLRRDLGHQAVAIRFTRAHGGTLVEAHHRLALDHGRYHLGLGALVPVTLDGERTVAAVRVPGTAERRLVVEEDEAVTLALALNGYPFGGKRRGAAFCCYGRPRWRWLGEMVGIQLAMDLAFAPVAERLYAGLLLEPVPGLGVGGGVALARGDALQAGFESGTLLENGAELPVDRAYFLRGYVGVTLSTGLAVTLSAMGRPNLEL